MREAAGLPTFANPRNATAGTLKQLDASGVADRGLSFTAHGYGEIRGARYESHSALNDAARGWGIPINAHTTCVESVDGVLEEIAAVAPILGKLPP